MLIKSKSSINWIQTQQFLYLLPSNNRGLGWYLVQQYCICTFLFIYWYTYKGIYILGRVKL